MRRPFCCRDSHGNYFGGTKTHKLHIPPNRPVKNFWSIVLYDTQTRSALQTWRPGDIEPQK